MEKRYFKLKDTSGTYWNVRLGVSFVRDVPLALESSPDLKMLLARGVIVEISKSDYEAFTGVVTDTNSDSDQSGEIVQPTSQDQTVEQKNPTFMESEDKIMEQNDTDVHSVDLHVSEEAEETAKDQVPGEGVSDLPPDTDPVLPSLTRKDADAMITAALARGRVTQNRGWFKYGDVTLGKGIAMAIQKLMSEPDLANKLRIELAG